MLEYVGHAHCIAGFGMLPADGIGHEVLPVRMGDGSEKQGILTISTASSESFGGAFIQAIPA